MGTYKKSHLSMASSVHEESETPMRLTISWLSSFSPVRVTLLPSCLYFWVTFLSNPTENLFGRYPKSLALFFETTNKPPLLLFIMDAPLSGLSGPMLTSFIINERACIIKRYLYHPTSQSFVAPTRVFLFLLSLPMKRSCFKKQVRIDRHIMRPECKMQVRPCRESGCADKSDDVALLDRVSCLYA
jgi:hypothetical protein